MTKKGKSLWQKEKLHVLCNFFFCYYVFKNLSAAEASESVYMRERVNASMFFLLPQTYTNPNCPDFRRLMNLVKNRISMKK